MSAPSERSTCATCVHWTADYAPDPTFQNDTRRGQCRAHPPVLVNWGGGWPPTNSNEWCGEHKPVEHPDAGKWVVMGKHT